MRQFVLILTLVSLCLLSLLFWQLKPDSPTGQASSATAYPVPTEVSPVPTATWDPKVTPAELIAHLTAYPIPTSPPPTATPDFCIDHNKTATFTHPTLGYQFTYHQDTDVYSSTLGLGIELIFPSICYQQGCHDRRKMIAISVQENPNRLSVEAYLASLLETEQARSLLPSILQPMTVDGVEGMLLENSLMHSEEFYLKITASTPTLFIAQDDIVISFKIVNDAGNVNEGYYEIEQPCQGAVDYFYEILDSWQWEK